MSFHTILLYNYNEIYDYNLVFSLYQTLIIPSNKLDKLGFEICTYSIFFSYLNPIYFIIKTHNVHHEIEIVILLINSQKIFE